MNAQLRIILVSAVSLGLGLEALWAAPFEKVHGNTLNFEQALKGAAPVQVCPGGGYISAGFTLHQGGRTDLDVYVVRTQEIGPGPVWERTYDLNAAQGDDVGASIREIQHHPQQGFIVTGTTRAPGQADRDVLLLRLDCDGNLLWSQTLRTLADLTATPSDDEARDVIETGTGAQMGDFVIAGSSRSLAPGPQDPDGYLIRTDPYGYPLWSRLYFETKMAGNPHYSEWLNAVAEAQPVTGQSLGDILAVGGQEGSYGNWRDGIAIRVSGTNGGFTAPLHTMALHNLPTDGALVRTTELWAIRELQQGSKESPELVMVGTNAAYLGASEGYAVKTGPNLNNVLVERLIGDGVSGGGDEGFTDAVEIAPPSGYANPGHLAVTGFAPAGAGSDLILLALDVTTLLPIPGTGRLLGDHGAGDEWGTALAQVQADPGLGRQAGFYLNGANLSDPGGVGDPEDMYLIKTDPLGDTPCVTPWSPKGDLPEDCEYFPNPQSVNPGTFNVLSNSLPAPESWSTLVCM